MKKELITKDNERDIMMRYIKSLYNNEELNNTSWYQFTNVINKLFLKFAEEDDIRLRTNVIEEDGKYYGTVIIDFNPEFCSETFMETKHSYYTQEAARLAAIMLVMNDKFSEEDFILFY